MWNKSLYLRKRDWNCEIRSFYLRKRDWNCEIKSLYLRKRDWNCEIKSLYLRKRDWNCEIKSLYLRKRDWNKKSILKKTGLKLNKWTIPKRCITLQLYCLRKLAGVTQVGGWLFIPYIFTRWLCKHLTFQT